MIYDNHNHLVANGDALAMVRAAEQRGLTGFLFTEHVFHLDEPRVASRYLGTRWDGELEYAGAGGEARERICSRQPGEEGGEVLEEPELEQCFGRAQIEP